MKRRVATFTLLLIGGAIVNIAMSWACAIRGISPTGAMHLGESYDTAGCAEWRVNTVVGLGSTHVLSQAFAVRIAEAAADGSPTLSADAALPWWGSSLRPHEPLREGEWVSQSAMAHGLPMRSMVVIHDEARPEQSHGLRPRSLRRVPHWLRAQQRGRPPTWPVELPLQPIWSGFVVNTLFYALLLWLIFLAPFAARRMIRRRRGECEMCAYPIGASPVCTECGAAVSRSGRSEP